MSIKWTSARIVPKTYTVGSTKCMSPPALIYSEQDTFIYNQKGL